MASPERLMLIDGHALMHRAFHALPPLSTSHGELTNAVFGFSSMLLKAIETIRPTHVIMAMDRPSPTFRHESYAGYKATRPRTPQELVGQFQRVREVAEAMNIAIYEMDGFEADDVLGTLARQAEEQGMPAVIVTGDLDALQLVTDRVHVLVARRGIADTMLYTPEAVSDRYGLRPDQLPDFKGLVGDTSDNIPGVPGIGEKTASKLLQEHGSLEDLYEHLDGLKGKVRTALEENREQAFASRELARIVRQVPMTLRAEDAAFADIDRAALIRLFRELEFRSLIERVQEMMPDETASSPPSVDGTRQMSMFGDLTAPAGGEAAGASGAFVTSTAGLLDAPAGSRTETSTRVVRTPGDLHALAQELEEAPIFAVDTETTSTDPLLAKLVGLSFASRPGHAWYVPVGHAQGEQLPREVVLSALRPLLERTDKDKAGHNLKYDYTVLAQNGIALRGVTFDTMLASYLLNPQARGNSLSSVALSRLGIEMTPIETLIGKGKNQITMDHVDIATTAVYAGADADVTLRLVELLHAELEEQELMDLFRDVEMPLLTVLADIEREGVALDTAVLAEMSSRLTESIGELEGRIYAIAGHAFNISSTQQLGQILFNQLKLPAGRRTKTGYSTDSEVLENLRGKHEIVDLILEYRQLIKLKSTYIDALPALRNPIDNRVHTDFNQAVASTGRLSSSNPNLQNIPIRTEIGRQIRRAFVPSQPGNVLLAADYSQIELRILASMSRDERLMHAFLAGEDVHRATASAVFGVPLQEVTADQRRIAKVVNFGIIYGIGEARLAYETGISRAEAAEFIAGYNRTYAGVKAFMDDMRKRAAFYGYVTTLLNRRRPVPDIYSRNPGIRTAAERAAINMPIQGTAADIIKIAMIRIHEALQRQFPEAHMVLQVHDELVFDVPREHLAQVAALVRDVMEHAVPLEVPLEIEQKAGGDWYDMEPLEKTA
jgi:DNA polymerase-1